MKKIVIVANFTNPLDGSINSRFINLAEILSATGNYDVEVVTSDFKHREKTHREIDPSWGYKSKITLCHEPGYISHKGPKRLYSHYKWGKSVIKYIKSIAAPDIIYCAIPSLTAAHDVAKYCKRKGIKFIIDVQDLWPEAIFMLADNKIIHCLTRPMAKYIDVAYRNADAIVAVSQTYVDRAKQVNHRSIQTLPVFLGNDGKSFYNSRDSYSPSKKSAFTIGYIGTLSYSYDIGGVIKAIRILNDSKQVGPIKFLIMGDGPLKEQFKRKAKDLNVDCEFTGMLPYQEMVGRLCNCDLVVNPIIKGAAQSITNKVGDYALAGLPVVNSQECQEYRDIIEEYKCGINCMPGDSYSIADAIQKLIENPDLRKEMGNNSLRLGKEKFDRRTSYLRIVDLIESLT